VSDNFDPSAQVVADHAIAMGVAAGRGSARRRSSRPAVLRADTPEGVCANCETKLEGPVCHMCGQVDDEYHRPVRGLFSEIVEGLFALDGRVARTIPALLLFPGRITRAFLKGKRMRYMPPFRLYIIASLIFFLLVPLNAGLDQATNDMREGWNNADAGSDAAARGMDEARAAIEQQVAAGTMSEEDAERALATFNTLGMMGVRLGDEGEGAEITHLTPLGPKTPGGAERLDPPEKTPEVGFNLSEPDPEVLSVEDKIASTATPPINAGEVVANLVADAEGEGADTGPLDLSVNGERIERFFAPEDFGDPAPDTIWPLEFRRYLGERFAHVADDPGDWLESAADWVPRVMFVMVPVYALLLGLVYVWRRGFYLYDHMIVSLHFHAALFLSMAILSKASLLIGPGWATFAMICYSNAYLYKLHRVVYERGRFQSVVRTMTLTVLYGLVLMLGLFAVFLLGAVLG
jgi:hypothetical protein